MREETAIQKCLAGEVDAFETLVRRYQGSLIAVARRLLGDGDEALDAVQETFVQAFVNLHRFDPRRNFKTWLLAIGVRRCLDLLKKRKTILNYFRQQAKELEKQPPGGGERRGIEESEIFSPLIGTLKPRERAALLLSIDGGYTGVEIAEILKCSENTVRVHLYNARRKLKTALHRAGGRANIQVFREVL
jgi:RNA polymerase sigma factor (sigma-70 family)